jgi:hypothetical protein
MVAVQSSVNGTANSPTLNESRRTQKENPGWLGRCDVGTTNGYRQRADADFLLFSTEAQLDDRLRRRFSAKPTKLIVSSA